MVIKKNSSFMTQVDDMIDYALDMLPLINNVFGNYTVHGIRHSINVIEYMYSLIHDIDQLSELEVTMLICSALLHDIGMVVTDEEIKIIKEDKATYRKTKYSKILEKVGDEKLALQEYIRPVHGIRAKQHIEGVIEANRFLIPGSTVVSFQKELALICMAHNEEFEWIKKNLSYNQKKGKYDLNSQYIAVLLRLADYLDIDEQRAPLYLYKYLSPQDYGDLEWQQHFIIENYDKVIVNEKTGLKEVIFIGTSKNPSVHRKLLKYFELINGEMNNAVSLCEKFEASKYILLLKTNVVNQIRTIGFSFSDLKLTLDYIAVSNLLMGEHIYGDKKLGLRELIQNSIDACKTMEEASGEIEAFRYNKYQPLISVILDKDRHQVTIADNGSGMSFNILKKYFLNVGVSYYASDDYLLQGKSYAPIGHYGIGFLACFMLSDKVEVKTIFYQDNIINKISFERNSEYICFTSDEAHGQQGTEIILDYEQCMNVFNNDPKKIVEFINKNFLDNEIPIRVVVLENGLSEELDCEFLDIKKTYDDAVCLNSFLEDIEVYIECTYNINFIYDFEDIDWDDFYYYNEHENMMEVVDNKKVKEVIEDGKITFLSIPVVDSIEEEEFLNAYRILEDYSDAIDKAEIGYAVNFVGEKLGDGITFYGELFEAPDEILFGEYTVQDFCRNFGHSIDVPVCVNINEKYIVTNDADCVLPYKINNTFYQNIFLGNVDACYLKGILLSEMHINIPFLLEGISLKGAVINIKNSKIIPNVSRNNISKSQQEKISFAIGKALHLWILEHASLSDEEKELVRLFIEERYGEPNDLVKI